MANEQLSIPSWLHGFNDRQIQAVTLGNAPLLILAGAGSGKTRVITARIAWLIAEKGFSAHSILAVTFTNKAAVEMRERAAQLNPAAENALIRTFHSFGAWLLRRNATAAGLSSNFTIYDDDDQVSLLSQVLNGTARRELKLWTQRIARAKDEGLGVDDDLSEISGNPAFSDIYRQYEERLRSIGNVDFGDLILLPLRLLQSHREIRERIRQRFRVVLIDEYQDTNVAQYHLLKELTGPETWLGVVGDDDQSIYRFRGAEVTNILKFAEIFPGTKVIKLEQNYRSTGTILDIATAVVSRNSGRLGKTLWTSEGIGEKARLSQLEDQVAEAHYCADRVEKDRNYGEIAILYRTNAQSRIFETVFRDRGIPYRIVGTVSFYQREEVKDILAYLAWIANPRDEVAFRRIANKPTRGFGKISVDKILSEARRTRTQDILTAYRPGLLSGKAAKAVEFLQKLTEQYRGFGDSGQQFKHLGSLVQHLAKASGLLDHYREIDRMEDSQRHANINELVTAAASYPANSEGLTAFLELVELDQAAFAEEEGNEDRVTLITMHNTKGLEFDHVIITGLEEGLFPRGSDNIDSDDLEEERRLFYVAITRARKHLAFTFCKRRMLWGHYQNLTPSSFLQDIPLDSIQQDGFVRLAPISQQWRPGTKLIHDEYGVGVVQKCLANGGHTTIHVQFESGRRATLLPEFSSHKIEILGFVGDDY